MFIVKILIILLVGNRHAFGARILAVFPLPSKSHQNVYDPLMVELANRGHEVVMITVYPMEHVPENLTQIDVSFSVEELRKTLKYADFSDKTFFEFIKIYFEGFIDIFEMQLQTDPVKKILEDQDEKFDLMILSLANVAHGFKHRYPDVPVITFASLPADFDSVGSPTHPVLYPEGIYQYMYDLSLWQKVQNIHDYLNFKYCLWDLDRTSTKRLRKYFGKDMPSLRSLKEKTDMLFVSGNPLISDVRPTVPAIVQTDRLHLKPRKSLPKDLQDFLDASTNGFIYMSLGSNVQSKDLSNETLQAINGAFSELPYNVLWKFELDTLPGLPANVMIRKWLPQQDLMGHKNIKAFIFQGGQQSLEESVRDSIPLICIPFAVDQKANAQKIEKRGIGVKVDFATMTKDILKGAIMEVTTNPKYKKNALKLTELVFDEPQTPLERAVWWTEYVIRHKGAQHLRSPALDTSYFEFFMLDVIGVLLAGFVLALVALSLVVKFLVNLIRSKLIKVKVKTN